MVGSALYNPPADLVERKVTMNRTWKAVLIGGEVTVLAAFTGAGLHLALQPHRGGQPPPLTLPFSLSALPPGQPNPSPAAPSSRPTPGIGPDLFRRIDSADRSLLRDQWDVLHRLIGAIEEFLRRRAVPDFERSR
jgi:hypothetical protein